MRDFARALKLLLVCSVVSGILYPLITTGIAQIFFPRQANGSLIRENGEVIGSLFIGQDFTAPRYFHGRPSAANYDASNSSATNYGPTSAKLMKDVEGRVQAVRKTNGLAPNVPVPVDLVTSSASGLDPDISLKAALLQVSRVASSRHLSEDKIRLLVMAHAEEPWLGFWGEERVNVLELNMALDKPGPTRK